MNPKPKRTRLRTLLLLAGGLILLEFVPGTYTIDSFQDEWEADSPEGILLQALEDVNLDAELMFHRPVRQRISRNAELEIPAGTTLTLSASMTPEVIDGEAVARPRTWELEASRNMTFIYRGVTAARAKRMHIRSDDPELRVRASGSYRVLTALATSFRYHRQREVKRDLSPPDRAVLNAELRFRPDHRIPLEEGVTLHTGPGQSRIRLSELQWNHDAWTGGQVDARVELQHIGDLLNTLLGQELKDPVEIGSLLAMKFRRIHSVSVEENRLFFHLDGSITSANSRRVEKMFDPSFEARLEAGFDFPEGSSLEEGMVGARLVQVHSFDINRSHNLLDKAVRNLVRSYRDDLRISYALSEAIPDDAAWLPESLLFKTFRFSGQGSERLLLEVSAVIAPPPESPQPET